MYMHALLLTRVHVHVHVQGLPRGKVYRYNPATRETHLLATGFFYSNGIAVRHVCRFWG